MGKSETATASIGIKILLSDIILQIKKSTFSEAKSYFILYPTKPMSTVNHHCSSSDFISFYFLWVDLLNEDLKLKLLPQCFSTFFDSRHPSFVIEQFDGTLDIFQGTTVLLHTTSYFTLTF